MLAGKPRMAAYDGLTDLGKTERAAVHLPTVLDILHCQLEHRYDEKSARPARRRTVAIRWVETDELLLEINVPICATRESSSARKSSATGHTSSPTAAAFSHARPCICRNKPCD